jgi:hypothetical protein
MGNNDLSNFADNLIKSLQQNMASRDDPYAQARSAISSGLATVSVPIPQADNSQSPGIGSRILDLLSRPLYGTANYANEVAKSAHNTDIGRPSWDVPDAERPDYMKAVGRGLAGKDKTTFSQVLKTGGASPVAAGVFGLAGDLAFDPLSYVGLPGASKLGSVIKGKAGLDAERDLAASARAAVTEDPVMKEVAQSQIGASAKNNQLTSVGKSTQQKLFDDLIKGQEPASYEPAGFAVDSSGEATSRIRRTSPRLASLSEKPRGNVPNIFDNADANLVASQADAGRVAQAFDELRNSQRYNSSQTIDNLYKAPGTSLPEHSFTRNRQDFEAWKEKYKDVIDPVDMEYIWKARNYNSFDARINQVLQRKVDKDSIRTFDDFAAKAKAGTIDEDAANKMQQILGVTSADEIPAAAKQAFDRYAEAQKLSTKSKNLGVDSKSFTKKLDDAGDAINGLLAKKSATQAEEVVKPVVDSGAATALANNVLTDGAEAAAQIPKKTLKAGEYHPEQAAQDVVKSTARLSTKYRGHKTTTSKGKTFPTSGEKLADMKMRDPEDGVPMLRAAQTERESAGVYDYIKAPDSPNKWPMGYADIYEAMPEFTKKFQYNYKTKIFPSEQSAGVAKLFDLATKSMPFDRKVEAVYETMRKAAPHANQSTADDVLLAAAAEIVHNEAALKEQLKVSMARQAGKDLQDSTTIANHGKADLVDVQSDPMVAKSEKAAQLTDIGKNVDAAGNAIGASPAAKMHATEQIAETAAKITEPTALSSAKAGDNVVKARRADGSKVDIKVRTEVHKLGDEAADDSEKLLSPEAFNDIDEANFARLEGRMRTFMNMASATRNQFRELLRSGVSAASARASMYSQGLNIIAKTHAPQDRMAAFVLLRQGGDLTPEALSKIEPNVVAAYKDMKPFLDDVVDTSTDETNALFGNFFRNGDNVDEVNKVMKEFGLNQRFDLKAANDDWDSLANQWREWEINDPIEFMQRSFTIQQHIAAKKSIAQEGMTQFGVKSARRPGPDFVKLDTKSMTELGPHLDPDLWYPRRAAEAMLDVDKVAGAAVNFRGQKGALASFVNNVLDPIMGVWKPYVTIARPGHHIRNIFGDLMSTRMDIQIAKGTFKENHKDAVKIMTAIGKLKKDPESMRKLLDPQELFTTDLMKPVVTVKGKTMSGEQLYKSALNHGLLPDYHVGQDLIQGAAEDLRSGNKVSKLLTENRYMNFMGKSSEVYSHELRLAHYLGLLKSDKFMKQFKTYDDAIEGAVQRVRHYHPDVTGLAPAEQKYMRRIIPFYSWIRQAIPLVMTTAFTRPGRITEIPKAFYNAQIAAGQNPDSMSEPFDPHQLYPSFIRDNLTGPVFGSVGLNFGSPTEGVLGDTLNGNVGRNVLSMLTPVAKAPVELIGGTNLGTGAPIIDKSDYIDSNLPGINQIASISGISPSGTVGNAFTGQSPVLDEQRAVQIGNKQKLWNQNLANFFLGLGIDDYEKANYSRIATREIGGTQ